MLRYNITIRDVAHLAGVSVSTVSRVLNNLDRVSDETRDKVQSAVKALSYTQNRMAVSMITGKTKLILIVIPDYQNNFFAVVVQSAEKYVRDQGYMSIVVSTGDSPDANPYDYLMRFINLIDGALVIPTGDKMNNLKDFPKPVVIVDRTMGVSTLPTVTVDNYGGAYQLTRHLIDNNHRRIAVICGDTSLNVGADRLKGFFSAMADACLPVDEQLVFRGPMCEATGYHFTREMLRNAEPPTAIIACNNLICIGCLHVIIEEHISLGQDISLVGFDDHDWAAAYSPGVTVAFSPKAEMGICAAQILFSIMSANHPQQPDTVVLPVEMRYRGSVAHLKAGV